MEIKHSHSDSKGIFYIELDGKKVGEMTYSIAGPNLIIIDHTEVGEELKGQGAGMKLLNQAIAYARENNIKIIPLCPFVKSVFDKKEDIRDVLSE